MKILAVDTASRAGNTAVLENGEVLAELQVTSSETHARRLMSGIDTVLRMAHTRVSELDAFAVTTGPGSFTGLRIGISAVKALGFATGKPITAVSTMDALAYQFPLFSDLICPLLDARKGEVYTALYKCGENMNFRKVVADSVVDPRQWFAQIEDCCLFVGEGAVLYRELITEIVGQRARFAPPFLNSIRSSVVGHVGMKQVEQGNIVDVRALVPYYIRRSDAETSLEKRRKRAAQVDNSN